MTSKLRQLLSPWKPGHVAFATPSGGMVQVGRDIHPYSRSHITPKECIVYTGCPVWRHRKTGEITTNDPFAPEIAKSRSESGWKKL